nr:hypothetical protein [Tanacetum cinerariifolium]
MLERGSYIPWESRFRRYLNRKRENRKWLKKEIDEGPYEFKIFIPSKTKAPRMQKQKDLRGDDLKHYEAEIEAMNLILISIPNDIYNYVDACTTVKAMWQRGECLMQETVQNKVDRETEFNNKFDQFVVEPVETLVSVYNRFAHLMNDLERNGIIFPKVTINTKFLNCLQPEWLNEKGHYACNCQKLRVWDSKYFMEQMLLAKQDEAGVILIDEQNDFLFTDASRMEEIKELSANICLMAKIQPSDINSDAGPSCDFSFLKHLARNAYKEAKKQKLIAKKVQHKNTVLTKQLELYKEKVRVFEMIKGNNTTYFNKCIEADLKAK